MTITGSLASDANSQHPVECVPAVAKALGGVPADLHEGEHAALLRQRDLLASNLDVAMAGVVRVLSSKLKLKDLHELEQNLAIEL